VIGADGDRKKSYHPNDNNNRHIYILHLPLSGVAADAGEEKISLSVCVVHSPSTSCRACCQPSGQKGRKCRAHSRHLSENSPLADISLKYLSPRWKSAATFLLATEVKSFKLSRWLAKSIHLI